MTHNSVQLMIQGITDTLGEGDTVVCADDRTALTIGFRVDGSNRETHSIALTSLRVERGLSDDIVGLISTGRGRRQMAWAMTHRHRFTEHGCERCAELLVLLDVMES